MLEPIPAPCFRPIKGKRNPPNDGRLYWVQLATREEGMGWVDEHGPWPVKGPKWVWDNDQPKPWDIVAVKLA